MEKEKPSLETNPDPQDPNTQYASLAKISGSTQQTTVEASSQRAYAKQERQQVEKEPTIPAPSVFVRVLLWWGSLVYLGMGLAFAGWPRGMAAHVSIQLTDATAISDFRAVYGGLQIGLGLFLAYSAWQPSLQKAGLLVAFCSFAGLAGVRCIAHIVDAPTSAIHYGLWGAECVGFLAAGFGLWWRHKQLQTASASSKLNLP